MIKVLFLAIAFVVLISLLKNTRAEYAVLLRIAIITVVLVFLISKFSSVVNYADSFFYTGNINTDYLKVVIKIAAVCMVGQLVADICRDTGETAVATLVELGARIVILIVSLPIIEQLLQFSIGLVSG